AEGGVGRRGEELRHDNRVAIHASDVRTRHFFGHTGKPSADVAPRVLADSLVHVAHRAWLFGRSGNEHAGADLAAVELDQHAVRSRSRGNRLVETQFGVGEPLLDVSFGTLRVLFHDAEYRGALDEEAVVLLE